MIGRKNTSSRLRHRLTLQQEAQTADDAGGYVRSWQNIVDLWAEILPGSASTSSPKGAGIERLFAGQIQAEVTHRIMLRYRADVTPGMRLVFENRAFNIRSVVNVEEKNDTLELLVQEGVAT